MITDEPYFIYHVAVSSCGKFGALVLSSKYLIYFDSKTGYQICRLVVPKNTTKILFNPQDSNEILLSENSG